MVKNYLPFLLVLILLACNSTKPVVSPVETQTEKAEPLHKVKPIYRAAYTRKMDLIHTRLNVSLNFRKKELYGQAAIIMRPHFYPSDSLTLNARGMELKEVSLVNLNKRIPLKFSYDSLLIRIKLDKEYTRDESFTVFVDYISRPDKLTSNGSEAIGENRGLYFINADGTDKYTPTQVWTQGETESNSTWFPTIEDPSQKMTQELYITVDSSMETISNGLHLSSDINPDGTRTDYWKQSLPCAPYLTMIAVGDFAIVKDQWNGIEVSYYVDPPYEKYARLTFGKTPKMMSFFSDLLGVPYVWEKYSQVAVHDYISGAMENNTAVIHGTNMQQDPRENGDDNVEEYISHELFHHWFGNLITCESWSNITLNEGFANYSEYLWREHEYGREEADYHNQIALTTYMFTAENDDPPLIRYNYGNREDLYDAISYNKGGRILHMLRYYVGDEAFFKSIREYLTKNLFSTVEVADLRLAFEKITGEDLNWFFNQWFFEGGHPKLNINYEWSDSLKSAKVTIKQTQSLDKAPIYQLPIAIDIYSNGKVERKNVMVDESVEVFKFQSSTEPDLINVEANKILLCEKTDNKPGKQFVFQYDHAPLYLDRLEAILKIGKSYQKGTPEAGMMMRALNDKFYAIRQSALSNIGELALNAPDTVKADIIRLATTDSFPGVRERALGVLGKYYSYKENEQIFINAITKDNSYKVVAKAFSIVGEKDVDAGKKYAAMLEKDSASAILVQLTDFYMDLREDKVDVFKKSFRFCDIYSKYYTIYNLERYIANNSSPDIMRKGIDVLTDEARKPQVSFIRDQILISLSNVEKALDKRITELQTTLEKPGDRKSTDIQSDLLQYNSIRKNLNVEIAQLEKR